ncbi:MAG: YceI family protein [Anaerolineae bacterium]|nr:YceI family protein [Anaerolineae bacterium]MDW8099591.1 YceI family protein [Anaerolineae bacterium]
MKDRSIRFVLYQLLATLIMALLMSGCAFRQPVAEPTAIVPSESQPTPTPVPSPTATPELAPSVTDTPPVETPTSPEGIASEGEIVRLILVPGRNEARYRVREQLVGLSLPNDAVGVTREITGTIVARTDGTILAAESRVQVDLRTLKSDESRRDDFIRRNTLQTDRFPFAVFVPTEIRGLALPLPESADVEFQLIGDLTIRDVTRQVTWEVKARIEGGEATGQATTSFPFAMFNLTQPRVPVVLSVEDNIRLELDFYVQRQVD